MIDTGFYNEQISANILPRVQDISFVPLHKSYLKIELTVLAIIWSVFALGACVGFFFVDLKHPWIPIAVAGLILTLAVVSVIITIKGFQHKGYALRNLDIIYKQGLIWKKQLIIPFNRIQHAEVNQGPLERMFDLGELKIYTAGGRSSDLSIKGISKEEAMSIKHFLLNKTALDDEEE